MKSVIGWIVTLAACGALVLGVVRLNQWRNERPSPSRSDGAELESVEVDVARSYAFTPHVDVIGQAVTPRYVELRNELAGRVVSVNFDSGAEVEEDAVVVQLDVSEEQALIASARARADLADITLKRITSLQRRNAGSRAELDQARADLSVAQADIDRLESIVAKKTVIAPFDGSLGLHDCEVGQYLEANTEITTLVGRHEEMWVDFTLPQFFSTIDRGTAVQIKPIRDETQTDVPAFEAVVIARNAVVGRGSRGRRYRASFDSTIADVQHNESLEIRVPVGVEETMVEVSPLALQHDVLGHHVFILTEVEESEGLQANRRDVTVVEVRDTRAILSAGVEPGERVAAAGSFKLHDGTLVRARPQRSSLVDASPASRQ